LIGHMTLLGVIIECKLARKDTLFIYTITFVFL
jgi:hypothetical protein